MEDNILLCEKSAGSIKFIFCIDFSFIDDFIISSYKSILNSNSKALYGLDN